MNAFNTDLISQVKSLEFILGQSAIVPKVLKRAEALSLPNWYLGAGCIAQTIWNYLSGKELTSHINDLDLVYFDQDDLTYEAENQRMDDAKELFKDVPIRIDVKNQARVHLWYEEHFGYPIESYQSVEDAINSWPTTATCVGVRYSENECIVYAPYGLNDLFGMIVKPNKVQITEDIYVRKVKRWKHCWPMLQIVPW